MTPDFSIVIPSRNRPALLRRAIESVLAQSHPSVELIVVDDGSDGDAAVLYRAMASDYAGRVKFFHLIHRPRGHGAAYAVNFGASQASGRYLGFLDDDDCWIDDSHLARADQILRQGGADLYFTDQEAWRGGEKVAGPIWIEDLSAIASGQPDQFGSYSVTIEELLRCTGFAHMNNTLMRRTLFEQIGGLDESNRWECDRDLYLRAIDRADKIAYHPATVARHDIPDPNRTANVSTRMGPIEKALNQIGLLDKSALSARSLAIRRYCLRHKAFALKKIAEALWSQGRYRLAACYAGEALLIGFSLKWLAVTLYLTLRGALSPPS